MADVLLKPNAQDLAALRRMFDRLRTEGKREFTEAVAWTAWYVGNSIAAQTRKCRAKLRPLHPTTAGMPEIAAVASATGRTPRQVVGYWNRYVTRFKRGSDGVLYNQLLNRDTDTAKAQTIRNQGFSKNTWRWMARASRRNADFTARNLRGVRYRNPLEPGYEFTNRVPWMHRIVGDLGQVFAKSERAMGHYFERAARRAARMAQAA